MKKKFNIKATLIGLAALSAGIVATAPAVVPQIVTAAETTSALTNGMYAIVRKINIYYKNDDGSVTNGGSASYTGYVSNKNMKFTFPEIKVADLFKDGLGNWKPDRDTIPSVTATYSNPPAEENIYLTFDSSNYVEESKTIKRTIKYYTVDENGKKSTAGTYSDSVTFKRPGYIDANGNKVFSDWTGDYTFKEITVPERNGYTPNMKSVPAKTVKPTDSDFEIEVLYSKLPSKTEYKTIKRTIKFVGKNSDGTTTSLGSATQSITLNREVYTDSNGKTVVARDWNSGTISAYTVPDKSGYTKEQSSVPALPVTSTSKDTEVTVYYTKLKSGFVEENGGLYYYENGQKLTGNRVINGLRYTFNGNGKLISEPFGLSNARPYAIIKDGWYYIKAAANTNFALDVNGASAARGANVQIYKANNTKAQKFYIKSLGNYEYAIYTGTNNMKSSLDVNGGGTFSGTNVQQWTNNNSLAQKWNIVMNTDGSLTFIANKSGLALDITGAKFANKTNVTIYTVNNTKAQKFILEPVR